MLLSSFGLPFQNRINYFIGLVWIFIVWRLAASDCNRFSASRFLRKPSQLQAISAAGHAAMNAF